ncbi:MAG: hypothetical protein C0621_02915 [Desulfuromonas sp.]|nr:MAG: hypothetical protein C0621_02915 [Desulfuromonas sp.]
MLLDSYARSDQKPIIIRTRNEGLSLTLAALLAEWQFAVLDNPGPRVLLLTDEEGLSPEEEKRAVILSRSPYEGHRKIAFPIDLETLWSRLETRFHRPPRNHLRISLSLPLTVAARDEIRPATLISLSDCGGRFTYHRELTIGEPLSLQLRLNEKTLPLQGRVIYCLPGGELAEKQESEVGILFAKLAPEVQKTLRNEIIHRYLLRVQAQIPGWAFQTSLGFFDIPSEVLKRLGHY